jgi:cupin fold WbuC family metalloprotein
MELNKELLNGLLKQASESERLRAAYDLRTSNNDGSQRMLNALQPGTIVPIHRHPTTVETVIIVKGAVTEVYFDHEGKETNRIVLDAAKGSYGLQIPVGQWHTVEVAEPCVILEIKDGVYAPAAPEDMMNI